MILLDKFRTFFYSHKVFSEAKPDLFMILTTLNLHPKSIIFLSFLALAVYGHESFVYKDVACLPSHIHSLA